MKDEMKSEKDGSVIIEERMALVETPDFEAPEVLYDRLIKKVREYHPSGDISMIEING